MKKHIKVCLALAGASALLATSACGGSDSGSGGQTDTLVADNSFNLQTIDPARQFEFTGSRIDDAVYQTALEFEDGDLSKPVPGLTSYEMSEDQKVVTLTLEDNGATFSDGSPVEIDDIVFSYQRLQGIGGNPSFFLDGVTVEKVDDQTMTLTSEKANPTLPYILPNSSLGVVNSEVVQENGGTTDENDEAQTFLDENTQGSGPYKVESYNPDSEVVLVYNEHYNGPEPKFKRVVLRNVNAETQLTNVQSGQSQVAFDLSPDQVKGVDENSVEVSNLPSQYALYVFMNQDSGINEITSNPDFQKAIRYAIDYDKVLELAGEGSQRLAGLVPNEFVGHVPSENAPERDLEKAKELLEKAGYDGEAIPFHHASDQAVSGVNLALLAETVQASLKEAGVNVELQPAPSTTQLDGFRTGEQPMGIGTWGADYPDPENYLVFAPDGTVAERVNWAGGSNSTIDDLAKAATEAAEADRDSAYSELYAAINEEGPYAPLVQPVTNVVISNQITSYVSNADNSFDFALAE